MAAKKSPAEAKAKRKIEKVMEEHKQGTLKSSSGKKVTNRKQAVAIALSEARRAGGKVAPRRRRPHPHNRACVGGVTS